VIEARQLTKRFGGRPAIEDVSLEVGRGEVVGFVGPNAAGKTTTLRVLAGVFPPTSGVALIDGHEVTRAPLAARRRLGYAPERPALHPEMTVAGLVAFAAAMRDVPGRRRREAVGTTLARTGLGPLADRTVGTLSKGVRQRVGLALALVGDPPALLLDEPTAGLDPEQSAETRRLVRELGREHAVLVSSHVLAEVETTCDRVVVLHRGRVLASGTPAALTARLGPTRIDVEVRGPAAAVVAALADVPGVRGVRPVEERNGRVRCRVELGPDRDARAALAAGVVARGWGLLALAPVEASLEEAVLSLLGTEGAAERRDA
jgi:ABC-2 type transport system ATP-binding protein